MHTPTGGAVMGFGNDNNEPQEPRPNRAQRRLLEKSQSASSARASGPERRRVGHRRQPADVRDHRTRSRGSVRWHPRTLGVAFRMVLREKGMEILFTMLVAGVFALAGHGTTGLVVLIYGTTIAVKDWYHDRRQRDLVRWHQKVLQSERARWLRLLRKYRPVSACTNPTVHADTCRCGITGNKAYPK